MVDFTKYKGLFANDHTREGIDDIFNLPAERPHTYETSALGAAIDGAVGLGCFPDFESAVRLARIGFRWM